LTYSARAAKSQCMQALNASSSLLRTSNFELLTFTRAVRSKNQKPETRNQNPLPPSASLPQQPTSNHHQPTTSTTATQKPSACKHITSCRHSFELRTSNL